MDYFPYHIRPIEPEKDAEPIAKLVLNCFRPWLDKENINYLHQLRDTGAEALAHPVWTKLSGFPYNIPGLVCTDKDGSIIGLVNTYSFFQKERKCCLISNVCVDPSHRREGIASHLLHEAESAQHTAGAYGLYLQARMEIPETYFFYKHNGFSVTDFRDTWIFPSGKTGSENEHSEFHTDIVPSSERENFQKHFQNRYPETVLWNLNYTSAIFKFGRINDLYHRLTSSVNRFRSVIGENGETKAWGAYQQLSDNFDQLWYVPMDLLDAARQIRILALLCKEYKGKKALKLDVPASESDEIFKKAGFIKQQTLAWMWKRL